MYKFFIATTASVILLSGCSTVTSRETASGDFNYVSESSKVSLVIPENVDTPRFSGEFDIPNLGDNAPRNFIGGQLKISSPKLVLPLVTGSRITEGNREAVVSFDQVDDSQPLDTTIWNSLINFLDEQGIGVVEFDKASQRLVTDWMIIEDEEETPWYSWTTTERSVGQRFEFVLDLKAHGRTASLKVILKDYLETIGEDVIADLDDESVRRNEIEILNSVISHYEKQIRIADVRRLRQIQDGFEMELGFNPNGDAAYIVDAQYSVAWPRLLLVLRKLGFDVKDLDASNGLLFVTYKGADDGWWSGLFGGDEDLPIDKSDYRLQVQQQGEKTSITFMDTDNEPLSAKIITDLYEPIATVMATENLDI